MRSDMSKVIVERPRRPATAKPLSRMRNKDFTDLPIRERMTARFQNGSRMRCSCCCNPRKTLSENLNPLRRFLMRRVGQKWDHVFSEICEHIRLTSTVQKHVRDHMEDLVILKTSIDSEGRIWDHTYSIYELKFANNRGHRLLWVHPVSGILMDGKMSC